MRTAYPGSIGILYGDGIVKPDLVLDDRNLMKTFKTPVPHNTDNVKGTSDPGE
jgi:hypothetical protein